MSKKNELEHEQMKNILYASAVGSLMYAQGCVPYQLLHFLLGCLGDTRVIEVLTTGEL